MVAITLRADKGSPLTNAEVDANFTNLNTGKLEKASNLSDLANTATARSNLGLGNVNNTSDANKPISTATQTALNAKENTANKGVANGYAGLDATGKVPAAQLPSYVDDVLEYASLSGFPATGEAGKIYVALDTNKTYRWSGSAYIYITSGAVDSVAGKTGVVVLVKGDVGLGNVDNTPDASKPISAAMQAALDLKQDSATASVVPSGAIAHFARNTAPTGWIKANGAELSRTTYADLFAAIGTTFGAGNGSTTFNVPDLRGEFIRSWDDGRGVDTGRGIGTFQADALKSHSHTISQGSSSGSVSSFLNASGTTQTQATGGAETRPRNIAMLACIKF